MEHSTYHTQNACLNFHTKKIFPINYLNGPSKEILNILYPSIITQFQSPAAAMFGSFMSNEAKEDESSINHTPQSSHLRDRPKRFKVMLLGDQGVGKTSFLARCISDEFTDEHRPTVGIDYESLLIPEYNIKLQIWDMAGQDRFRCLVPQYIDGSDAVIVVYDVNRRESFLNSCRLANYVRDLDDNVLVYLVGNKNDRGSKSRQVSRYEGEETAADEGHGFFECSAKAAYPNPKILMNTIAKKLGMLYGIEAVQKEADTAAGTFVAVDLLNRSGSVNHAASSAKTFLI